MFRTRLLAGGMALCAAAGLVSATAPAVAAAGPVRLAGTNVIKLSAPAAHMTVDLPQAVSGTDVCIRNDYVRVTGTADLVVVMLIPLGVTNPVPVVFGRLPRHEGADTFFSNCVNSEEGTSYLAAGRYDLYALRTAGTATVTLKLWTMLGVRRLAPGAMSGATIKDLPAVQPYAGLSNVSDHGDVARLGSTGFVWTIGWTLSSAVGDKWQQTCVVGGSAATTLELGVVLAPGCPLGGPGNFGAGLALGNLWARGQFGRPADTYAAGYLVASEPTPLKVGAIAVWVPSSDGL